MDIKNSPEYKSFVKKIRVTGIRVAMMSFLYWMLIGICVSSSLAILYLIVDRIFYPIPLPIFIIMPVLVATVLGFGIFGFFIKFPTLLSTAIRIDDHLKSDERISSAFLVDGKNNFEQALISESMLLLKSERVSGMLKKDHRKILAFASTGLAMSLLLFFILPVIHSFVKDDPNNPLNSGNLVDAIRVLNQSDDEWQRAKSSQEILEESSKLIDSYEEFKNRMKTAKAEKNKYHNPRKQKELLSESSSLRDKIKKQRDELNKLMNDVNNMKKDAKDKGEDKDPGKDEFEKKMDDFEKNLREGDFSEASKSMQNLLDAIQDSEKSEELKKQLAEKMKELSERFSSQQMQDMLDKLSQNLNNLNPNQLSNEQMQDLLNSMNQLGDMTKLMNNQQLLDMLENQLKLAQDKMTGG